MDAEALEVLWYITGSFELIIEESGSDCTLRNTANNLDPVVFLNRFIAASDTHAQLNRLGVTILQNLPLYTVLEPVHANLTDLFLGSQSQPVVSPAPDGEPLIALAQCQRLRSLHVHACSEDLIGAALFLPLCRWKSFTLTFTSSLLPFLMVP